MKEISGIYSSGSKSYESAFPSAELYRMTNIVCLPPQRSLTFHEGNPQ